MSISEGMYRIEGKGGKARSFYLDAAPAQAWADYLAFAPGSVSIPLSVSQVERIVDRYFKLLGVKRPGRSAHALRHTAGLMGRLGGAPAEAIAQQLGHSSTATTDLYTRAAMLYQENPGTCVGRALAEARKAQVQGERAA